MLFVIGFALGAFLGILAMCLMAMARDPFDVDTGCTHDCNQGRTCTCWQTRQRFDEESA